MWFKMHPWVFPIIIGIIGLLYIVINIGANIETRKIQKAGSDHHVSGVPLLGGIHLLIAGLISPCKWLALLFVLDYTIWLLVYSVFFEKGNPDVDKDDKDDEKKD